MPSLDNLKHQLVRDLAISCFSTPLIADFTAVAGDDAPMHCSLQLTDKRLAWLQQLDQDLGALINHIESQKPTRLGLYHEALWHFFLQYDDDIELINL